MAKLQKSMNPQSMELSLAVKLGSIAVHTEEMLSPGGHDFDIEALKPLLADPEVREWIKLMGPMLPLKRSARRGT